MLHIYSQVQFIKFIVILERGQWGLGLDVWVRWFSPDIDFKVNELSTVQSWGQFVQGFRDNL